MKKIQTTILLILILLLMVPIGLKAQTDTIRVPADTVAAPPDTAYGKIASHELLVTYDKTTHIIFPSAIRYVDLGSENITAGKAEEAENVLRVKAAVKNFENGCNLSVITEDGKFYNFNVWFSEYPDVLTLNFASGEHLNKDQVERQGQNTVIFKELGTRQATVPGLVMKTLYQQSKAIIRHIGSESFGIQILLKGIFTLDGQLYFVLQFKNATHIPFAIDFISFKVLDKKIAKRTVMQERVIKPLREYLELSQVDGTSVQKNVYLLEQMTIPDDKLLVIEIYEKNGGRHQFLRIENADLVKARPVKQMHLDFK
ncbi:Bacteroides conjugative transposon TraN protein [Chryseobacterium wanjuense]|uniref:Bacteroides conjugative transposon TraN protein n=1 Tax=Chryseobacterium wanjuense TaxID=356305 RepID=A0A1I0QEB6_9FLAO|nr:conjugative transposon protein TraN [Chryseobacterium wanjuense]SEW25412.1 Bacteroides conjugative transposon TraN protein [Chryseobacterium wanjuense]